MNSTSIKFNKTSPLPVQLRERELFRRETKPTPEFLDTVHIGSQTRIRTSDDDPYEKILIKNFETAASRGHAYEFRMDRRVHDSMVEEKVQLFVHHLTSEMQRIMKSELRAIEQGSLTSCTKYVDLSHF